jgi:capsular exopolysaccharide synthesis family protein
MKRKKLRLTLATGRKDVAVGERTDRQGRPNPDGVPLAAIVPRTLQDDPTLVVSQAPHDPIAERFRKLRSRIESIQTEDGDAAVRSIMVTSAIPDEGKTTTAFNLALALAEDTDRMTVLVDADLRRPSLARFVTPRPTTGLMEILKDGISLDEALVPLQGGVLSLLPAGGGIANPTSLLKSDALERLFAQLRERFDWVVIDSPPCVPFADAHTLHPSVDGAILVVRAASTSRATVERALETLADGPLLGIVLNDVRQTVVDKYYYRYDAYDPYGYAEDSGEDEK